MALTQRRTYLRLCLHCVLPLLCALAIYAGFRTGDTVINRILFPGHIHRPAQGTGTLSLFIIYNLPGALWLYSFIAYNAIYGKRKMDSLLPLGIVAGIELAQYFHITDGTFDPLDLLFYFITWAACLLIFYYLPLRRGMPVQQLIPLVKRRHIYAFFISIIYLSDVVPG